MVTIQERRKARQAAFKAKFVASGKKKASSLSKTAERTAQRRGRGFDPLETVIIQATNPPPPPPPPPKKPTTICDVLGGGNVGFGKRGATVPRGVNFACGGQPIQFNAQSNNTTRQFFGSQIAANQQKIRNAGLGFLIPKSPAQISNAERSLKIARKKGQNTNRLKASFCKQGYPSSVVSKNNCKNLGLQGFDVIP